MGQAYIMRRGGSNAVIRARAYPSAEALPENALRHTIAVITERTIGYAYMQETRPENAAEGDIWLAIGGEEGFSYASGRAKLAVGIAYAEQYDGVQWKRVEAYAWTGEAWIRVSMGRFMLYDRGGDVNDVTGGWASRKDTYGKITWNEESLYLGYSEASGGRYASVYTKKTVDLTAYTKLAVNASATEVGNGLIFGAAAAPYTGVTTTGAEENMAAYVKPAKDTADETIYEADISALSGGYYIQLAAGVSKATIHEIYLC